MDSCMVMAPATTMATNTCGTHLRARVLEISRASATFAGWQVAQSAPMAISLGHRYNQIKFPPRMGSPSCSPPV